MSFLFGRQKRELSALVDLERWGMFAPRSAGKTRVTPETALRHSAVWACLRLRANLISSLPVDVYRTVGNLHAEVAPPTLLTMPDEGQGIAAWLWATQYDLDRYGNTFGLITKLTRDNHPARIELLPAGAVTVRASGRKIVEYEYDRVTYTPDQIWHEKQYRPAGSPMGLSPIAYAAMSINGYLSAQQFALDWYNAGASPAGVLRNTVLPTLPQGAAEAAKDRFKTAVQARDIFVTGRDWEFTPAAGDANSAAFIEQMKWGIPDVCRYMDVPADMVDGSVSGESVTYANVTQRNVQLLVISLTAPITRREWALTQAIPRPQFVKLNSDALLRMDPKTRAELLTMEVEARILTPNEARALDDRPPLTEDDYVQFERLGLTGKKQELNAPAGGGTGGTAPSNGGADA